MSTEEKNRALVCRFLEAQSEGDLEALDELLAPDFVDHGLLPSHDPRREGFMQGVAEANPALSLIRTTIEYQGTDGDDMVITRHKTRTIHDRGASFGLMRRSTTKWSRNRTWVFRSKCATLLLSKSVHVKLVPWRDAGIPLSSWCLYYVLPANKRKSGEGGIRTHETT